MLTWLTGTRVELCFFNLLLTRLGASIVTVMFVLAVTICFYELRIRLGVTGTVNSLTWLTCSVLQTIRRSTVNTVSKV